MIDLTLRMDYADVFDFDKFHEVFRQQLSDAKGGERFTLQAYIEEHHELWRDYDVTKTFQIAEVLELEVSNLYGIFPDPEDYITLPTPQRPERTRRRQSSIRDLAKEFLENKPAPQDLEYILGYVNEHRERKTNRRNIQSSLCQDKDVFIHFKDIDRWGLCSIDYTKQRGKDEASAYSGKEDNGTWCVREDEPTYNIERTNLSSQSFIIALLFTT